MRRPALLSLCLALPPLLGACGDEFSNAPFEEDARFVAAAPSAAELRIGLGGLATLPNAAIDLSALAEGYVATRRTSLQLNALAFGLLRDVDDLLAGPPTTRARGQRVWLPAPHALDPIAARFEMRADGAGGFTYTLGQRRRTGSAIGDDTGDNTADAFTPVMHGAFTPDPAGGIGELTLDLGAAAALIGGPERGRVYVDYTIDGAALTLAIGFEGVVFEDGAPASDATYAYTRDEDGAGTLDFAFEEDGQPVALRSRWRPDGRGRVDARVSGGRSPGSWSECWGADFRRVYVTSASGSLGDPKACAYPDASPPAPL